MSARTFWISWRAATMAALSAALLLMSSSASRGETLTSDAELASKITVQNVQLKGVMVTGEVVNLSATPLRDVKLLVRNSWLWTNERHPGEESPGRATYYTVPTQIPAGGKATFEVPLPAAPASGDQGHYEVSAEVVGYTQVGG